MIIGCAIKFLFLGIFLSCFFLLHSACDQATPLLPRRARRDGIRMARQALPLTQPLFDAIVNMPYDSAREIWDTTKFEAILATIHDINEPFADPAKTNRTALHEACFQRKNIGAARLLLAHGAEVNIADSDGNTPLHLASMRGKDRELGHQNIALIVLLLEHGANKDALSANNRTPLLEACLSKPHAPAAIIELLVSRASIDTADFFYGTTALIAFCKEGTRNIPFGAYTDLKNYNRCDKDTFDALAVLIAAGAKLTQRDSYGQTALFYARPCIAHYLSGDAKDRHRILDIAEEDVRLEFARFAPKPSGCCVQ